MIRSTTSTTMNILTLSYARSIEWRHLLWLFPVNISWGAIVIPFKKCEILARHYTHTTGPDIRSCIRLFLFLAVKSKLCEKILTPYWEMWMPVEVQEWMSLKNICHSVALISLNFKEYTAKYSGFFIDSDVVYSCLSISSIIRLSGGGCKKTKISWNFFADDTNTECTLGVLDEQACVRNLLFLLLWSPASSRISAIMRFAARRLLEEIR